MTPGLVRCVLAVLCLVSSASIAAPLKAGDPAPAIAGYSRDGEPVALADYRGRVVVVSFWASWCPPCLKEMPILEGIQETAGKRQIQVIAVNMESIDTYRQLARKLSDFQIMLTHDAGKDSSKAYGVNGIPHMVIIDRAGRIVRINRGYTEKELDRIIGDINKALLARSDPSADAAPAASP